MKEMIKAIYSNDDPLPDELVRIIKCITQPQYEVCAVLCTWYWAEVVWCLLIYSSPWAIVWWSPGEQSSGTTENPTIHLLTLSTGGEGGRDSWLGGALALGGYIVLTTIN